MLCAHAISDQCGNEGDEGDGGDESDEGDEGDESDEGDASQQQHQRSWRMKIRVLKEMPWAKVGEVFELNIMGQWEIGGGDDTKRGD